MTDREILARMSEQGPNYAVDYGEDPRNWVMSQEEFELRQEQLRQPGALQLIASVLGFDEADHPGRLPG